ncbi:MAG: hypothetical protein AMXMBFR44_3560 [Candidatus Campbellbacteria bacterium]
MSVLELLYPRQEVFVHRATFDDARLAVQVACTVPHGTGYCIKPVPYVTAENYVRCLSQTSYLLAHHLIAKNIVALDVTLDQFVDAMCEFQLYYRNLSMTFHKRVARGEEFPMELVLKDVREIKRLNDFILFTFSNLRTVISGEMSFIIAR